MNRMHDVAMRIEKFDGLDAIAEPLGNTVKKLIPPGRLKDLLSGTWLGHQLHPLLTDVPIGAFTCATVLDLVGRRRAQPAANILAALGVVSTVPTAAAGLADWSDTTGPGRRIGVVHAAANLMGIGFYIASISARRRGNRVSATALGLIGMGTMSAGGYLGGHLTFVRGVGVNRTFMEEPSPDWTIALPNDELKDGVPEARRCRRDTDDAVPVGRNALRTQQPMHARRRPAQRGRVRRLSQRRPVRQVSMASKRVPTTGRSRGAWTGDGTSTYVRDTGDRQQDQRAAEMNTTTSGTRSSSTECLMPVRVSAARPGCPEPLRRASICAPDRAIGAICSALLDPYSN